MSERYYLYELLFPNGKLYFGITNDPPRRWREHRQESARGGGFRVNAAIRKYGHEAVKRRVVVIGGYEYIRDLEIRAIEAFKTSNKRYGHNISLGGDLTSPETRLKLSAGQKRRWRNLSDEERTNFAKAISVRSRTPERRAQLSAAFSAIMKGKKKSPAHCAKIRARNLLRGSPSAETLEKQRAAWTPEKRAAHGATKKGRKVSEETRRKLSKAGTGRKHRPDSIEKMRVAQTPEMRAAAAERLRVHKQSPEFIEKIASWHRGKKREGAALERIRHGTQNRAAIAPDMRAELNKKQSAFIKTLKREANGRLIASDKSCAHED